jgi:hypothetical protein
MDMKKLNLFKRISLYFSYRKNLLKSKDELTNSNIRIDRVNRIYTVVNIPPEIFDEPYNMRTSDINKISEPYISEYIKQISNLLNSKGLTELYKLYDVQKIDKFSYLVIIGFSFLDTAKIARNFLIKFLPITLVLSLILVLFFKFY